MTGWLLLFALVLQAPGVTYTISWDPVPTPVQQTPVCTAPDTPVGCHEQVAGQVTSYKLLMGNTPGKHTFPVGVFPATQTSAPFIVQPTDPQTYYFVLKACAGEACSVESAEVSTAVPAPDPCLPPFGPEVANVFVTGWQATSGMPGSKMRVNYQLASKSPIVEVAALLTGGALTKSVVAKTAGTDLTSDAGVWFVTPTAGSYQLTVSVKNAFGCTREAVSAQPVVVK